jgi:hypothetical protein
LLAGCVGPGFRLSRRIPDAVEVYLSFVQYRGGNALRASRIRSRKCGLLAIIFATLATLLVILHALIGCISLIRRILSKLHNSLENPACDFSRLR